MPFTAVPHHEKITDADLKTRIEKLYDASPEFSNGATALEYVQKVIENGDTLYLGMFNEKPIASVTVQQQDNNTKLIKYIVIHPANRGRGIAFRFIEQICKQEKDNGVAGFEAGCGAIKTILTRLNYL